MARRYSVVLSGKAKIIVKIIKVKFTRRAAADLDRLSVDDGDRIVGKLRWLASHPETKVERLTGMPPHLEGLLKLRVGSYRALFWFEENTIVVYRVGHRSTIYKDFK